MSNPLLAGFSGVFAQRYGEPFAPEYLGCHDVTYPDIPQGDVTLIRCPDAAKTGAFKVVGSYQGTPGVPTFTVTTLLTGAADILEDWPCLGNIIVNKQYCGRRDLAANWVRRFVMYHARMTGESGDLLAARNQDDSKETVQTFPFSAEEILKLFQVTGGEIGIPAAVAMLNAIATCNSAQCAGVCGDAMEACEVLWTTGNHITGSALDKADVFWSADGGATWTPAAAQPFAIAEDIAALVCFPVDNTTTRVMVLRGTTDAGNGPEIAYTDDDGATWTVVEILSTHALYGLSAYSLFALDYFHIWAVTDDGGIAFSADGGVTWTAQGVGATAVHLWAIAFANASVGYIFGATGVGLKTTDGGLTWALMTLPAAYAAVTLDAVEVLSESILWVAAATTGTLLYSSNGGATWVVKSPPGAVTLTVIEFAHPMVGWAFGTNAGGAAGWRTTDGGATWDSLALPTTMTTVKHFAPCTLNSGILVGGSAGDGVVVKFVPV